LSRNALSITTLIRQINALAPHRSKLSDGTLGNKAHQALGDDSDHNPWFNNIVTAVDTTDDPSGGLNGNDLADALVKSKDQRIKYIIHDRKKINLTPGHKYHGIWRPYTGLNAHATHVHLSVLPDKCDIAGDWNLWIFRLLTLGMWNGEIGTLQRRLNLYGATLEVDEKFGPITERAVRSFQRFRSNLTVDGIVGPATKRALGMITT